MLKVMIIKYSRNNKEDQTISKDECDEVRLAASGERKLPAR